MHFIVDPKNCSIYWCSQKGLSDRTENWKCHLKDALDTFRVSNGNVIGTAKAFLIFSCVVRCSQLSPFLGRTYHVAFVLHSRASRNQRKIDALNSLVSHKRWQFATQFYDFCEFLLSPLVCSEQIIECLMQRQHALTERIFCKSEIFTRLPTKYWTEWT